MIPDLPEAVAVLVVGAGPTGLMLANILGAAGVETLLVEANPATVGEPRAVSIDDETLRTVQGIGLLTVVGQSIVAGYGSEYRSPSGDVFLRVDPTARPFGHPRRNAFRQPTFERQLRDGLARFATVTAAFETRVVTISASGDGVDVTVQGSDGERSVRAGYVVGCDGASSTIRSMLGATLAGDTMDERWLIVDLAESPAATRETIVFCDPARPCIALPGPNSTRRYEFKLLPGERDSDLLEPTVVARLLGDHDAAPQSRIVRTTVYHFHARIADLWQRGRVVIAGDAAHLSPPFAGQGMNSGIRDAANLGWKLAAVVTGRLGPALLTTYQRERADHVAAMIRLARRMGAIMGPPTKLHGRMTRTLFRALGVWPAARSFFAEMKYKPAPRFADGFVVRSQLGREPLVGRMLPQPKLPDGTLLDDRLGPGFVLLGLDIAANRVALGRADALIDGRVSVTAAEVPPLAAAAGKLILIRPDRYVMAVFAPEAAPAVAAELDRLIAATWDEMS